MASANSTPWATSRVAGLSWIQYSGANSARTGDQWSASSRKCAPIPSDTPRAIEVGAWKCAYPRIPWSKMTRSNVLARKRRNRMSESRQ